ncbi:uncharacterized protein LOC131939495 [Physella acuta]|uniref:uncharacterized protein LOC131939495 n=1 Tax=Physella acuta TaxID=109671 RepID=UPI0027DB6978|nr:uncharacterized protein LOC131939495 [Physella acuta]XP_059153806.1 uncharacterized protein LOC131939495 [Physella acuta]XP_059153807.1 uncharacterized protein LOC131939495 [Physella acuta]
MHVLRREFQVRKIFYTYLNERVFYCCQWRWPRPVFVIIRVALCLYTTYGFIHLIVDTYTATEDTAKVENYLNHTSGPQEDSLNDLPMFVYFTVWSYFLLMVHMTLAAILVIVFYKRAEADVTKLKLRPVSICEITSNNQTELETKNPANKNSFTAQTEEINNIVDKVYVPVDGSKENNDRTLSSSESQQEPTTQADPKRRLSAYESFRRFHKDSVSLHTKIYFKISWCLSDVVSVSAPIVTIIFFCALYPQMKSTTSGLLDIQNTNVHALNFVFVIIDHMISARPIRLLHCLSPLIYGAIYIVFSVIYWSFDKNRHIIYPGVLDWNKPGVAVPVALGLAVVAIPLLQLAYFGMYRAKCVIHKKLYDCSFNGDLD